MSRPRLLDGCCCGGGAGVGYARAGFDVTGMDREAQPDYPLPFVLGDILTAELDGFEWVHISPPCQRYSPATPSWARERWPDLVDPIRERMRAAVRAGVIKGYVIENVPGAPLRRPVTVCGSAFGLGVQRHRLFEASVPLAGTGCAHGGPIIEVYGGQPPEGVAAARVAMGIDWLPWDRLVEAIPPAYTEYLGRQILRHLTQVDTVTRPAVLASAPTSGIRHPGRPGSVTSPAGDPSPAAGALRQLAQVDAVTPLEAHSSAPSVSSTRIRHESRSRSVALVDGQPSRGCQYCGEPVAVSATGRWRRYCRQACRQAAYRDRLTTRPRTAEREDHPA
jgi:DNA (cytosine-5)-methyltransferase 1